MYGLAALRIGYGLVPPWASEPLEKVRQPFNVGSPSVASAIAALSDRGHVRRVKNAVAKGRKVLEHGLLRLGLPPVRGQGNFVFLPMSDPSPASRYLLRKGIAIRALPGLGLRITVGRPSDNARVLSALRSWLSS